MTTEISRRGHCRQYGGVVVRTIPAPAGSDTDGCDTHVVASRAGIRLGLVGLSVAPDRTATVSPIRVHPVARPLGIEGLLLRDALAEIARRRAA